MVDTKFWKQVGENFVNIAKPFAIVGAILLVEWFLYRYVLFGLSESVIMTIYVVGNVLILFFFVAYTETKPRYYDSIPDDG